MPESRHDAPDVTDDAIRKLFAAHRQAEHHREHGGPQRDLHAVLRLDPPEDKAESGDFALDYVNFMISGPPDEAMDVVLRVCDAAPDDASLCWVGTLLVEPLLGLHWNDIGERFEREARRSASLRAAYSCALVQLPRRATEWKVRMQNLVGRTGEHA